MFAAGFCFCSSYSKVQYASSGNIWGDRIKFRDHSISSLHFLLQYLLSQYETINLDLLNLLQVALDKNVS